MDTSILLAKMIGPVFLVVAVGALISPTHYFSSMISQFFDNAALLYLSGTLAFVVGMAIILHHNLWVADWRVAITLIGWLSLIKGATLIVCPKLGARLSDRFAESGPAVKTATATAILILILGAWLAFQGFQV